LVRPINDVLGEIGVIKNRSNTILAVAKEILNGNLELKQLENADIIRCNLLDIKGIGDWSAEYLLMRGYSWADAFLVTDLGIKNSLANILLDEDGDKMYYAKVTNKFGNMITLIKNNGAIAGLWYENQKYFPVIKETDMWIDLEDNLNSGDKTLEMKKEVYKSLENLQKQLKVFDEGKLKEFDLKLEPKGTDFQLIVWEILSDIPYGETTTYGEISKNVAARLGRDRMSAQAVGGAIGHNPISVIVPCHRVVGANGSLTGYAGGIDKKKALLAHEQRGQDENV